VPIKNRIAEMRGEIAAWRREHARSYMADNGPIASTFKAPVP
jgi:hypothetical protein